MPSLNFCNDSAALFLKFCCRRLQAETAKCTKKRLTLAGGRIVAPRPVRLAREGRLALQHEPLLTHEGHDGPDQVAVSSRERVVREQESSDVTSRCRLSAHNIQYSQDDKQRTLLKRHFVQERAAFLRRCLLNFES